MHGFLECHPSKVATPLRPVAASAARPISRRRNRGSFAYYSDFVGVLGAAVADSLLPPLSLLLGELEEDSELLLPLSLLDEPPEDDPPLEA